MRFADCERSKRNFVNSTSEAPVKGLTILAVIKAVFRQGLAPAMSGSFILAGKTARKRYRVLRDRIIGADTMARTGNVVFLCASDDFGLARQDTRTSGKRHIAVTYDPGGGHPIFTIPRRDLEEWPE